MTIDEEIVFERKLADYYKKNHLKNEAREHKQLAEWLEELKALKNGLNIKCDSLNESLEKGKKVGYNNAIDDFVEKLIRYVDCGHLCSPTEIRWSDLSVVEMVKKLAEQLKAGDSK